MHTGVASDNYSGHGLNSAGVINWDPNCGLPVAAENSNNTANTSPSASPGTQSAALGLLHEFAHATDPNFDTNLATLNSQYDNNAEQYAVGVQNQIASALGEPERFNHTNASGPVFTEAASTTNVNNVFNSSGTLTGSVQESQAFSSSGALTSEFLTVSGSGAFLGKEVQPGASVQPQYFLTPNATATTGGGVNVTCNNENAQFRRAR